MVKEAGGMDLPVNPPVAPMLAKPVDVIPDGEGRRLDFEALRQRIHPAASRAELLAPQTPGHFMAFDLLALGDTDYMERPFAERRAALEAALANAGSSIHLTQTTTDRAVATGWFSQFEGAGLDGLIAKPADGIYEPDRRGREEKKHAGTRGCGGGRHRGHKSGEGAVECPPLGPVLRDGSP